MLIDVHTHAFRYPEHISDSFLREAQIARGTPIDLTIEWETYRQAMEPVEKAIVFGLKARHVGIVVPDGYIADFVRNDPDKLIGFCCVDPNEPTYREDFLHAIEDLKLAGIKLAPMYADFSPLDDRLTPIYERAQRDGLPVLSHIGTTFCQFAPLAHTRPILIDELAMRFPRLKFIMAHLGHPWEPETLVVIRKHPNVWSDLSALYYRPWQLYNSLVLAQEYGVMKKILFGSDYPFATPADSIAGLRRLNNMVEGTNLPRISHTLLDEIIYRDSLAILFGDPR
ncbi:MAG TPA: amidohydrolase family protein [Chthonomonadaceae bacterium]|nr:amidohydrolase family protein [Chthonomonadaceae bacterium]